MTTLTIHRGTKEIGGTCIELRHEGFLPDSRAWAAVGGCQR